MYIVKLKSGTRLKPWLATFNRFPTLERIKERLNNTLENANKTSDLKIKYLLVDCLDMLDAFSSEEIVPPYVYKEFFRIPRDEDDTELNVEFSRDEDGNVVKVYKYREIQYGTIIVEEVI